MTDSLPKERLDELEALAANATPGPWAAYELPQPVGITHATIHSPHGPYATTWDARLDPEIAGTLTIADAKFIAATDPDTVCALIARVREAEAKLAQVRALHHPVNIEPSGTICAECSNQMPNGRYLPTTEWPCPTVDILDQTKDGTRE